MAACTYCGRRNPICHNTRDMEEFAIIGDRECFFQLQRSLVEDDAGGEKGLRYIVLNSPKKAKDTTNAR